ncbi:transcriptional regulator [Clostridium kluyveri]|uniref:Transcriptional regulator n=1 Tax=Clostridium kluyveri TaxID=1534 RepID=A0A1L5FE40_CLOKL|nr:transcriptional regulator [Clostridium kluyveri]
MKDRISITDLARLRNVTTETLRHYDRIGLFKPTYVDPKTGYRYYSVLQYEKLGTIKELRQLGMSLKEIKEYFNNRHVSKSLSMLINKHNELGKKIKDLQLLEETLSEKIQFLQNVITESKMKEIIIKQIPEREIVTLGKTINNELELSYGFLELENALKEISPILASNRLGFIISKSDIESCEFNKSSDIFVFTKASNQVNKKNIQKIKGGKYACIYNSGKPWDREESIKKIIKFIYNNHYVIDGELLEIAQVDITVTDIVEEECFEIQVPIK